MWGGISRETLRVKYETWYKPSKLEENSENPRRCGMLWLAFTQEFLSRWLKKGQLVEWSLPQDLFFPCRYSSSKRSDQGHALCLLDVFCFESTEGLQSLKMGQTSVPESVRPSHLMQEIFYLAKPGRLACVFW